MVVFCGGFNGIVPHRLLYPNVGFSVDCLGRTRRCGLVGRGVALLEEVCHWDFPCIKAGQGEKLSDFLSSALIFLQGI